MAITNSHDKFVHELADMYDPELRDSVIRGAAARAEHCETVAYRDLIDGAEAMRKRKAVKLLTENREQETSTARKLERLAPRLGKAAA